MDCSPLGSSVHDVCPARILEWVAITFSRGISHSRGRICVSYINIQKTKIIISSPISSVQFISVAQSCPLQPHESQHARPPCPSPTPGVHSDLCPSSQWCHPAISSSVVPFSSCPQSLPASESFPKSQPFTSGGQSIRVSASASVLISLISFECYRCQHLFWRFQRDFLLSVCELSIHSGLCT